MRCISLLVIAVATASPALPVSADGGQAETSRDDKSERAKEREIRTLQKQIAKLQDRYDALLVRCTGDNRNRPDARACDTARILYLDVQQLKKQINALSDPEG